MSLTADELRQIEESPFKADFPLLAENPQITFLDSAATAQRPATVLDAERRFYETMNANPLRGLYGLSVAATAAIEDARTRIARLRSMGRASPRPTRSSSRATPPSR